jgi:nucleotide-binding universal stress UspA family protein
MSAIAAKILGKHHAHVYQEVGHRHRLSYADLDALLDREEKQLAAEHKRQRAQLTDTNTTTTAAAVDTNTTLAGGHDHGHGHPGTRSSSSSIESSSSGSEDEADWHAGGEHEEDLLLELEETTHESIHTVTGAEDHLVQDIDHIVHVDITDEQLERMKRLLGVNCLHRGDIEHVRGKRWMVAVDGSEASRRAYEGVLRLMDPALDHLLVVTVCDKNLPRRFALCPSEETQLRFELWKAARHIIQPYVDELSTRLAPNQFTVMVPGAWDARRMLCNLCQRYNIDTLCVGKHGKGEHNHHHHHLRSLHSYTQKHAKCHVIVF